MCGDLMVLLSRDARHRENATRRHSVLLIGKGDLYSLPLQDGVTLSLIVTRITGTTKDCPNLRQ